MAGEHYFTEDPSAPLKTSEVSFEVGQSEFLLTAGSGTFSSSKLDPGTRVLLSKSDHFPTAGNVLDLGCGWGPISCAIARLSPETKVWALDINQRSLDLTQKNASRLGLHNIKPVVASQIPDDVQFSSIWSNPPIRIGKQALHELLNTWIPRLAPEGEAMLVVAKQLGADSLSTWLQNQFPELEISRFSTDKGYRVLRIFRPLAHP